MPEGLKLIVTSDVTQAEQTLKQFVTTAGAEGERAATSLTTGLNKVNPAATKTFSNLSTQAKAAIKPISLLGDSIETLRAKMLAKQQFIITEKDITKVAILNKEIKALELEITRISNVGKTGFDSLGNKIVIANAEVKTLKSTTGSLASSFGPLAEGAGKAFSILRQVAFILPGIGIAGILGGITSFVAGLVTGGDKIKEITGDTFEFQRAATKLKEEIDAASQSIVSQAGKFRDLKIVLVDVSNKYLTLADSVTKQGIAQLLFTQKEGLVQKLLSSEIENQLKLLKQREGLKEFKTPSTQVLKPLRFGTDAELKKQGLFLSDSEKKIFDINKLMQSLGLNFSSFVKDIKDKKVPIEFVPHWDFKKFGQLTKDSGFERISLIVRGDLIPEFHIKETDAEKARKLLEKAVSKEAAFKEIPIPAKIVINAQQLTDQMNDINKIIGQGFADIFAGIGESIATGDITNITKVLGSVIAQIGKALIQYGIVKTGLDKVLKGGIPIPGAIAIALGISAVAIGTLIKNAKPQGFFEGGFTGAGNPREIAGVVHKGEFVIPADIVRRMGVNNVKQSNFSGLLGGGAQVVILKTIISGNNLALVQGRTGRSQKRLSA